MEAEVIAVDEMTDYAPKVRDDVARRIAAMVGIGGGLALDAKPFFKLNTSLTTSPALMAYAMKPKFTKAEAMELMRRRMGV